MIQIVNAGPKDIPTIQHLAEKTWWPTYASLLKHNQIEYMLATIYSDDTLAKVMHDGSQQFILLRDDQGPQGFASYGPQSTNEKAFKLHKLYILPENQGKGYGVKLIDEVKQRLTALHIHILDLNVYRNNPARTFYEKVGFRIIEEVDIPFGQYTLNDYIMRINF